MLYMLYISAWHIVSITMANRPLADIALELQLKGTRGGGEGNPHIDRGN